MRYLKSQDDLRRKLMTFVFLVKHVESHWVGRDKRNDFNISSEIFKESWDLLGNRRDMSVDMS